MTQVEGKQKQRLRKGNKKRVQNVVWILDSEFVEPLTEAEALVRRLEQSVTVRGSDATDQDRAKLAEGKAALEALKEEAKLTSMKFVFQAMGRKKYDDLFAAHPPTQEQIDAAKVEGENVTFNPETFPYALIDHCCIEPEHEPGEVEEWLLNSDDWNQAEINDLFNAALACNIMRGRVNLGKG